MKPISISRPIMDPSYELTQTTDPDKLLAWDAMGPRLVAARNYWVSTTRPDGRPHAMPVWGLWFAERFYFGTGGGSRKHKNLQRNYNIVVHLESGDDVLMLEGVAARVTDVPFLTRLNDAYTAKYGVNVELHVDNGNATYGVELAKAMAWLESDFVNTATRWLFG